MLTFHNRLRSPAFRMAVPAVRLPPTWPSPPHVHLCVCTCAAECCWTKTLLLSPLYLKAATSTLQSAPSSAWPLQYVFFWGKCLPILIAFLLASSLSHLIIHLLLFWENRNHLTCTPSSSYNFSPFPFLLLLPSGYNQESSMS